MTPTKPNGINIGICCAFILSLFGCSHYQFQHNGTVVNGQLNYYVNENLGFGLYLLGDFQNFKPEQKVGMKTEGFYPRDKEILDVLGNKPQKTSILFSAKPILPPFYHFLAVLKDSSQVDLSVYDRKFTNDTLAYYLRKLEYKDYEIAQTLIPYKNRFISFIYYDKKVTDCHFCDIEEITRKNCARILNGTENNLQLVDNNCTGTTEVLKINIPKDKILAKKQGLLMAYRIDSLQKTKTLEAFKIVRPGENNFTLQLCKGSFLIKYMKLSHYPIWSISKEVN